MSSISSKYERSSRNLSKPATPYKYTYTAVIYLLTFRALHGSTSLRGRISRSLIAALNLTPSGSYFRHAIWIVTEKGLNQLGREGESDDNNLQGKRQVRKKSSLVILRGKFNTSLCSVPLEAWGGESSGENPISASWPMISRVFSIYSQNNAFSTYHG